jgi:Iron-containing redox enzyme
MTIMGRLAWTLGPPKLRTFSIRMRLRYPACVSCTPDHRKRLLAGRHGYAALMLGDRLTQLFAGPPAGDVAIPQEAPGDERDELVSLLAIYDLWWAPIDRFETAEWQQRPDVAALKWELERCFERRLDSSISSGARSAEHDAVSAMRAIAARDRVPSAYTWLATTASWDELVQFLAIEGGPDGGFDDLVSLCQVGIAGRPKVVLAENYWDEMGNGCAQDVHTTLHDRLVDALGMPRIQRSDLPVEALRRSALNGLLATNRRFQPELLGALGLLELQAGPRCRQVLRGLRRLGAPSAAFPFYEVHAEVDPRHGKEWLEGAIGPLADSHPRLARAIVRGAWWRSTVNEALFARLHHDCAKRPVAA